MGGASNADIVSDAERERVVVFFGDFGFLREGIAEGSDFRFPAFLPPTWEDDPEEISLFLRSIFWKYFCACVRTCTTVRVPIIVAIVFHCFPWSFKPSRKTWCSSSVHRPTFSSPEERLSSTDVVGVEAISKGESPRCIEDDSGSEGPPGMQTIGGGRCSDSETMPEEESLRRKETSLSIVILRI